MTDVYCSPRKSKASRRLADMLNDTEGVPESVHQYLSALPDTPQAPRTAHKSSALSRYLSRYDLPSNDALASLPPLPDTPRQPSFDRPTTLRKLPDADVYTSSPVTATHGRTQRRHDGIKLNDHSRSTLPTPVSRPAPRSHTYTALSSTPLAESPTETKTHSPRFPSQPAYPMLSSRQSGLGLNTARTPSGSYSPFVGIKNEFRTSRSPTPAGLGQSTMYASVRFPNGLADASMLQDASFGTMGGRDSLGSLGDDSWEMDLGAVRRDKAPPSASTASINEMSSRTSPQKRDVAGTQGIPSTVITATSPKRGSPRKGSPAKRRGGFTPAQALGESLMLPTPTKGGAHLLESVNALNRVDPPWLHSGGDSSSNASFLDKTTVFPAKTTGCKVEVDEAKRTDEPPTAALLDNRRERLEMYPSASTSGSPMKASTLGGFLAPPVAMPRHKLSPSPSSPSKTSLSSASATLLVPDEKDEEAGDISTLLPVSPMKHRHLLSDDNNLLRERLDWSGVMDMEGPSMFIPPLPQQLNMADSVAGKNVAAPPSIKRDSPRKHDINQTMDLKDMMAMFRKPRASGGEETFMDLMNASMGMDDMDGQLLADETFFLPLELRPSHSTLVRSKSLSRIETEKRIAKVRASIAARDVMLTSPDKASLASNTASGRARASTINKPGLGDGPGSTSEAEGSKGAGSRGRSRDSIEGAQRTKRVSLSAGPRLVGRSTSERDLGGMSMPKRASEETDGQAEEDELRENTRRNAMSTGISRAAPVIAASSDIMRSRPVETAQSGGTSIRRVASGTSTSSRTSGKSSAPPAPSAPSRSARSTSTAQPVAPRTRTGLSVSAISTASRIAESAPRTRMGSTASLAAARTNKTSTGPIAAPRGVVRSATTGAVSSAAASRLSTRPAGAQQNAGVSSSRPATTSLATATASSARMGGTSAAPRARTAGSTTRPVASTAERPAPRTFGSEATGLLNRGSSQPSVSAAGTRSAKSSMPPPPLPSKRSIPPASAQTLKRASSTVHRASGTSSRPGSMMVPTSTTVTVAGSAMAPSSGRARSTPANVVAQAQATSGASRPGLTQGAAASTLRAPTSDVATGSASASARAGMPFRSNLTSAIGTDMPASFRTALISAYTSTTGAAPKVRTAGSTTSAYTTAARGGAVDGKDSRAALGSMRTGKLASGTGSVSRALPGAAAAGLSDIRAKLDRMRADPASRR